MVGGVDYKGRICGYSAGVAQRPLWNVISYTGKGKCLEECPTVSTWDKIDWFKPNLSQMECKDPADMPALTISFSGYDLSAPAYLDYPFFRILNGDCMFKFASKSYLGFCVLNDPSVLTTIITKYFAKNLKLPPG